MLCKACVYVREGVCGYLDDGSLPPETCLERLFLDFNNQVLGAGALGDLEGNINVDQGLSPLVREGYFVSNSFSMEEKSRCGNERDVAC